MKKVNIICTGGRKTFIELVKSIEDSIAEICEYETHWVALKTKRLPLSNNINIIVHGRFAYDKLSRGYNILVQTEQPSVWSDSYDLVLDFFENNNIYLPIGYSKYFDYFGDELEEDINFFFCGGVTDVKNRRKNILKKYNIDNFKIFGEERDKIIKRTKFNINILNSNSWKYTPLRGALIFCKGKVMFQEKTIGYGFHSPYIIEYTQDNFLDVIDEWRDNKKRKEFGMYIKESIMKTTFKEIFLNELVKRRIL